MTNVKSSCKGAAWSGRLRTRTRACFAISRRSGRPEIRQDIILLYYNIIHNVCTLAARDTRIMQNTSAELALNNYRVYH